MIAGVLSDFPPFGFRDENGTLTGFDIELMSAVASKWEVEIRFVALKPSDRISALLTGEVDIISAALTLTQNREELVDFSQIYYRDEQGLLISTQTANEVNEFSDLKGKSIAAISGTTSIEQIKQFASEHNMDIVLVPFLDYRSAHNALENASVDAMISDRTHLQWFADQPNSELKIVGESFSHDPYALGIRPGDTNFRQLVDAALQQLVIDGTYDKLYQKWFLEEPPTHRLSPPTVWPFSFSTTPYTIDVPERSIAEKLWRGNPLVVGVHQDSPPLGRSEEDSCFEGFEIGLVREFANRWTENGESIELIAVDAEEGFEQLLLGELHMLAGSIGIPETADRPYESSLAYGIDAGSSRPLAFMLPPYDHQFRDLVNFTLQAMAHPEDGTYDQIHSQWCPEQPVYDVEIWPGLPEDSRTQLVIHKEVDDEVSTASEDSSTSSSLQATPTQPESTPLPDTPTSTPTLVPTSPSPSSTSLPATPVPPTAIAAVTSPPVTSTSTASPTQVLTSTSAATMVAPTAASINQTKTDDLVDGASAPDILPHTGASLNFFQQIPVILLFIVTLFGVAIFQKRCVETRMTRKSHRK